MIQACFAGCDISSRWLDLCILGTGGPRLVRHDNTADGIAGLVGQLRAQAVSLLVIEPSGGYERALLEALWAEGLPVALVPALRVRQFARARGRPAKTDRLDARLMAEYGARMRPDPTPAPDENRLVLRALVDRRRTLVETRKAERQRIARASRPRVLASLQRIVAALDAEIAALEAEIRALVAAARALRERARRLLSCPGIGPATAAVLLAQLPELGTFDRRRADLPRQRPPAGVRHRDRRPRGRRAASARQRRPARHTLHIGRAKTGARCHVHGRDKRRALLHIALRRPLHPPARPRQTPQGRPHRNRQENPRDTQCHAPR